MPAPFPCGSKFVEPQSPYRLLKNIPCKNRPSTFYLSTELLCTYKTSQNFLFHFTQGFHFSPCTELRLLHEQYKDICPIIYKTQQNTKLIIIHRACNRTQSFIYHIHRTQSFPGTHRKALCFFSSIHRASPPREHSA